MEESQLITKLRQKLAAETDTLPSSQERVVIDVAQLDEWFIGTYGTGIDPESIALTSMDLAEFRTWLLRTCKPATVQRKLASIRSMLKLLAPTVLTSLRMPKLPPTTKPSPSGWTRTERLAILRGRRQVGRERSGDLCHGPSGLGLESAASLGSNSRT